MNTQESFHREHMLSRQEQKAILPASTIYERMFRVKPYTKCMNCIQDVDRMRCQKCMQQIISSISSTNESKMHQPRKVFRIKTKQKYPVAHKHFQGHQSKHDKKFQHTIYTSSDNNTAIQEEGQENPGKRVKTCENKERFMITSKYKHWMGEKQKKKGCQNTINYWPKKRRNHDYNLQKVGAKQPRFEKWEKKLLDQLLSKTKKIR